MAREVLHRIIINDSPRVLRLEGADYYRPLDGKKRLAGRVDPNKVMATKFFYLFAKYGPVAVAKDYMGINLGICTTEELDANSQWLMTNSVYRSAGAKPQTLKTDGYQGNNIVLLVPHASRDHRGEEHKYLMDFVGTFFYVADHFPASESNLRDPNLWKLYLGLFTVGYAPTAQVVVNTMVDHIQAMDKTMSTWYPRR